jgi:CspA family cold shock protein
MGKGRDRGPRRRDFDDDFYAPPWGREERPQRSSQRAPRENPAPSGPAIDGIVKWFAPDKGFGFVELADGSGDAFLHVAVLQGAGYDAVDPETRISVQVGQGQKGRQVTAVLSVDAGAVGAPRPSARSAPHPSSDRRGRADLGNAVEIEGTVKWFNPDKGFGFVVCEDGGQDVFLHISVVERARLRTLNAGQRLAMKVVKTPKGREAAEIIVLD